MRFFVFFLICQEMNQESLTLATTALSTFMNGKQLNVASVLQAGLSLSKTLRVPGLSANVTPLICKALDMLLTEALAKVGESNAIEATVLAECKKCVETVLPVVLEHLSQESAGVDAGAGAGLVAAAAAAAAAPVAAKAEAAVAAAAVAAGVPVAVVAQAEAAVADAVAAAVKTSGFFGLSCLGCAGLPVEVLAAVPAAAPAPVPAPAPAPAAAAAAAAAPAEPPKADTPQTPPKESETQAAVPEPQAAAPPAAAPPDSKT